MSTCEQYHERLAPWLAGDLDQLPAPHAPACPLCGRHLGAATRLRDGLDTLRAMPVGLEAARAALAQALATRREPLFYDVVDSPVGPLLLAASQRGLRAIHFLANEASDLVECGVRDPERLGTAREQLAEYFAGHRTRFDLPVDLQGVGEFGERVLRAAAEIPFGRVSSYGDLARAVGTPGAARAVGGALGRNPIPIVIPCHRILRGDGSLGGYSGGLWIKDRLLTLEGVRYAT
jgi:O-6-methylguanine DNA methyltransferase